MQEFDQVRWRAEEKAIRKLGATSCEVEVGAISMSGTAVSTNPAELFVEFGLEIKERSPFDVTLISELANVVVRIRAHRGGVCAGRLRDAQVGAGQQARKSSRGGLSPTPAWQLWRSVRP